MKQITSKRIKPASATLNYDQLWVLDFCFPGKGIRQHYCIACGDTILSGHYCKSCDDALVRFSAFCNDTTISI